MRDWGGARVLVIVPVIVASVAARAEAQVVEPIGPFVVDLRGSMARYGQEPQLAASAGLPLESLPAGGLGLTAGAHWYPVRWRGITFGLGAEVLASRGRRTAVDAAGEPTGPTAETRFSSFSPQLSFNFGAREGWSYLSGGIGASRFEVSTPDFLGAGVNGARAKTINYGGGARWFARPRVAFSFDVRFHAISPGAPRPGAPERPRMTRLVISAGISVK